MSKQVAKHASYTMHTLTCRHLLGVFLKKRKKMLGIKPICMHLVHIKRCQYWILQIKQKSVERNNIILEQWWKHTVMNNAADSIYSAMITGSLIAHNWLLMGCHGDVHCWRALLHSSSRWQQNIVLYVWTCGQCMWNTNQ